MKKAVLMKGEKAPFNGILLDEEKAMQLREIKLMYKIIKESYEKLKKLLKDKCQKK